MFMDCHYYIVSCITAFSCISMFNKALAYSGYSMDCLEIKINNYLLITCLKNLVQTYKCSFSSKIYFMLFIPPSTIC